MGNGASATDSAIVANALKSYAVDHPARAEILAKDFAEKTGIDITCTKLPVNGGNASTCTTNSSTKSIPTPTPNNQTGPHSNKPHRNKANIKPAGTDSSSGSIDIPVQAIDDKAKIAKTKWVKFYKPTDKCANTHLKPSAFASPSALTKALAAKVFAEMNKQMSDPVVSQVCQLRAMFKWITKNVSYSKRYKKVTKPEEVLALRKTASQGYANLFASLANITLGEGAVRVIVGYAKGPGYRVGQSFKGDGQHAWVMATVSEHKFLFDPTLASVQKNKKGSVEFYWMTDPELFVMDHFPDDEADQLLGPRGITLRQFEDMAYLRPDFHRVGMSPHSPNTKKSKLTLSGYESELVLCFGAPRDGKVIAELHRITVTDTGRKRREKLYNYTRVWRGRPGQPLTVQVRAPEPGQYVVRLFVRRDRDKRNCWGADYSLRVDELLEEAAADKGSALEPEGCSRPRRGSPSSVITIHNRAPPPMISGRRGTAKASSSRPSRGSVATKQQLRRIWDQVLPMQSVRNDATQDLIMATKHPKSSVLDIKGSVVIGINRSVNARHLHTIVVPPGVTEIRCEVFSRRRGITSVSLPGTLTTIGDDSFGGCSGLTTLTLPDTLTDVGDCAFRDCSGLTSLTLPDTMTSVGTDVFSRCRGLTTLTLPDTMTSVGDYAFSDCMGITSLALPDALTSVGDYAFSDCIRLTSVTLPDVLTNVGSHAFAGCRSLTSVVFRLPLSPVFIVWAVSSMRNRSNWQLTTIKYLRNVLAIITEYAFESRVRDVGTVDPGGRNQVFEYCPKLV